VKKVQRFLAPRLDETRNVASAGAAALLNDLNRGFRALYFACPADQTFIDFCWDGFLVFDFVDGNGTSVDASSTSCAFGIVDYYLHHFAFLQMWFFIQSKNVG
jgi:hypothetical protein